VISITVYGINGVTQQLRKYALVIQQFAIKIALDIVDLPTQNGDFMGF
jgi:hypothetical protein